MATNWLLRIGDGEHFNSSSEQNIWGIKSPALGGKNPFIKDAEPGDLLWFVTGSSNGHIVALATYERIETRVLGPLIATTQTNDDLGWNRTEGEWDIEVHFNNLYNLTSLSLFSEIKGSVSIRRFNDKCKVDLPTEYKNILRYSKVTNCM
jgi:hypothetical protein